MNRTDILQRFRDRIAQKTRIRLTKDELEMLIQSFIERLKTIDDQAAIDHLCTEELALLEEGYPQASIAKNYIPVYRKAILAATDNGTLPLTENTLLDYNYIKRNGEVAHFHGHYAYTVMKYGDEYTDIAQHDNARNNQKQDTLKPVQFDRYLELARELLMSHDHNDLAVGLAAVTGRRFSEVIQQKFSKSDDPYRLHFAGQLKKREETETYHTLCLIPASEVWKAIQRFRKLDRIQELQGLTTQKINARMNKSVQRATDRTFGESGIVPTLEGESATTIHNLRAVYAISAIHLFCPPNKGDHRFLQEQLGHIIGQRNLQTLKNSPSTAHYFHYYLVDSNGHHIGAKGVLLGSEPMIQTQTIQADLPETAQPEVTTSETQFMNALTELSNTIGYLRKDAEEHKQKAEAFQSERNHLKLEVEILQNKVKALEQAKHDETTVAEPLKRQIEMLQAENEGYKAKLQAFGRLLGYEEKTAISDANPIPPTSHATQTGENAIDRLTATAIDKTQPDKTAIDKASRTTNAKRTASIDKTQSASTPKTPAKRKPNSRSARGKLEGAVKFIQHRNQQVEPDDQWAITQSLIASLTGSNISFTVKPFWQEIKAEMEKYNHSLAMDERRQNYGRTDELPQLKAEFDTWMEAQIET